MLVINFSATSPPYIARTREGTRFGVLCFCSTPFGHVMTVDTSNNVIHFSSRHHALVSQLQMLALQEVSETRLRRDEEPIPAFESDVCRNLRKRDTISPFRRADKKEGVCTYRGRIAHDGDG